jgi:hypothetical protein
MLLAQSASLDGAMSTDSGSSRSFTIAVVLIAHGGWQVRSGNADMAKMSLAGGLLLGLAVLIIESLTVLLREDERRTDQTYGRKPMPRALLSRTRRSRSGSMRFNRRTPPFTNSLLTPNFPSRSNIHRSGRRLPGLPERLRNRFKKAYVSPRANSSKQ